MVICNILNRNIPCAKVDFILIKWTYSITTSWSGALTLTLTLALIHIFAPSSKLCMARIALDVKFPGLEVQNTENQRNKSPGVTQGCAIARC